MAPHRLLVGLAHHGRATAVPTQDRRPAPRRHARAPRRHGQATRVHRPRHRSRDDPRPPPSNPDRGVRSHTSRIRAPRPGEQERRVTSWGRVLATVCRTGRIATLQVLERTLPDSGTGLAEWWAAHGAPTRRGPQTPTPNSSTAPDPLANDTPPYCHSVST